MTVVSPKGARVGVIVESVRGGRPSHVIPLPSFPSHVNSHFCESVFA